MLVGRQSGLCIRFTADGIDLAKNLFQVHGVDEHWKTVLRKQLKREQMAPFFFQLADVLDWNGGVWECSSLGTQAAVPGHTMRLIAPQFVKPYIPTWTPWWNRRGSAREVRVPARRKRRIQA